MTTTKHFTAEHFAAQTHKAALSKSAYFAVWTVLESVGIQCTGADVGYDRFQFIGTQGQWSKAHAKVSAARDAAKGRDKAILTHALQNFHTVEDSLEEQAKRNARIIARREMQDLHPEWTRAQVREALRTA